MEQDAPLFTLKQGDKIYSLRWSRAPAPGSGQPLLLASASLDCTTKVWAASSGACLFTLRGHTMPVYSVDFSPDGLFLVSGAFDNNLFVWSLKTGELVQTHRGAGGVFEVFFCY
jgi:transducin (beta)-like 1